MGSGLTVPLISSVETYIQTYVHTYIHTYIHTYVHTYIHACTYIHIYRHVHTDVHSQHRYRYKNERLVYKYVKHPHDFGKAHPGK